MENNHCGARAQPRILSALAPADSSRWRAESTIAMQCSAARLQARYHHLSIEGLVKLSPEGEMDSLTCIAIQGSRHSKGPRNKKGDRQPHKRNDALSSNELQEGPVLELRNDTSCARDCGLQGSRFFLCSDAPLFSPSIQPKARQRALPSTPSPTKHASQDQPCLPSTTPSGTTLRSRMTRTLNAIPTYDHRSLFFSLCVAIVWVLLQGVLWILDVDMHHLDPYSGGFILLSLCATASGYLTQAAATRPS